jgi:hypothetical protein
MAGGITAIIGNRAKGDDGPIEPGKGEEEAIRIAFAAMLDLHHSYPLINAE